MQYLTVLLSTLPSLACSNTCRLLCHASVSLVLGITGAICWVWYAVCHLAEYRTAMLISTALACVLCTVHVFSVASCAPYNVYIIPTLYRAPCHGITSILVCMSEFVLLFLIKCAHRFDGGEHIIWPAAYTQPQPRRRPDSQQPAFGKSNNNLGSCFLTSTRNSNKTTNKIAQSRESLWMPTTQFVMSMICVDHATIWAHRIMLASMWPIFACIHISYVFHIMHGQGTLRTHTWAF